MAKFNKYVGLSGTQGSGKTTILKSTEWNNKPVIIALNTSSRQIVSELGIKFDDEYYSNPSLIRSFQIAVLKSKIEQDLANLQRDTEAVVVLTDRTYLDLQVYTTVNLGNYPSQVAFIEKYNKLCTSLNKLVYDDIILTPFPDFKANGDNVRPTSPIYQQLVHYSMRSRSSELGDQIFVLPSPPENVQAEMVQVKYKAEDVWRRCTSGSGYINPFNSRSQRVLFLESLYNSFDSHFQGV